LARPSTHAPIARLATAVAVGRRLPVASAAVASPVALALAFLVRLAIVVAPLLLALIVTIAHRVVGFRTLFGPSPRSAPG
jgi:hypothetical protein